MTNEIDISDARHAYEEYKHAEAEEARWKEVKTRYWQEMQDRLGADFDDADALVIDGRTVEAWDRGTANQVSVPMLKKLYPEIAKKVTETKPRRTKRAIE